MAQFNAVEHRYALVAEWRLAHEAHVRGMPLLGR